MLRKWMFVWLALLVALAGASPTFAQGDNSTYRDAVYVMTNDADGNQVIAYRRGADGGLTMLDTYDTGGLGSGVGVTVPIDPLGSQNSLLLSKSGKWLFAVNAGSDEITAFKAMPDGLEMMDRVDSGGDYPVSLAFDEEHLYVLNAGGEGNITGFRLEDEQLVHIDGSTRSLDADTPADGDQPNINEAPSQVGFDHEGRHLLVTDKGGVSGEGRILVYSFEDGVPGEDPEITTTEAPVPFAFTFDRFGQLLVVEAMTGTIFNYRLEDGGSLEMLDSVETGQMAVCWIDGNGRYFFTSNTASSTVSAVRPSSTGHLNLLNATAVTFDEGTAPLDIGVSFDRYYLYTLNVGDGTIGAFRIDEEGNLHELDVDDLPSMEGLQGIAVH